MNRLNAQRVYLAGAMDRVPDRGNTWRDNITPFLEDLGIVVFNPIKKPSIEGKEDEETHRYKLELKKNSNFDELSKIMKMIRSVDLRLVDISDFLIVNLDIEVHPCGTYEEIFLANRSKKPVIIHIEQGKSHTPDWLFGTVPHQMIFSSWEEVKNYLLYIDSSPIIDSFKRWQFFQLS
jgi:nucleoside 2-deoxyribosyltransferase